MPLVPVSRQATAAIVVLTGVRRCIPSAVDSGRPGVPCSGDNGVCSLCGLDTVALESELRVWLASIVVCRPSQSGESIEALLSHDGRTFSVGSFSAPKANCIWGGRRKRFAIGGAVPRSDTRGNDCGPSAVVRVPVACPRCPTPLPARRAPVGSRSRGSGRRGRRPLRVENLRTLCLACHGKENAALAARRRPCAAWMLSCGNKSGGLWRHIGPISCRHEVLYVD